MTTKQYRIEATPFATEAAAIEAANRFADKHGSSFTIRKYRGEGFYVLVSLPHGELSAAWLSEGFV